MAYFSKNGNGIDSNAYIYVQLQVTRTDYPTYSRFSVKSVAVSDTGTSSFIRGQVTTNQGGTSWTAATGWKSVSYNGTTTLATATFDVARGASDKTATCKAYAEGGGTGIYAGGTDTATLSVTVPKVLSPNAPSSCSAAYVTDSQATVSWTNGTADTDHPRDATLVERRDGSNEWAQVASVGSSATSYTDNGISPNGQYQYRVRAKNAAGYSAYSTSGSIYTTPAPPASVTLDKTAATTVQVDATGTWVYAVTYDVELTYDSGATWSTVATSTSLPYSATVSGGTVQFRVRATRGALASAWTLSASLVTITPPLAPTIVQAPANPSAYGDSSVISWTPNHPDGSAQASAEIKVTNPGGTSTTYTVTTATSYTLTPNATGTWTAQVRTKGLDPSYGEWSQSVSWAVANPPAVVITSPATDGTDINALPMTVSWTVTDSTGVSTQRIIIEGEAEILNRTLAGDVRTLSLTASDVDLVDGETYTIRIRVMGGSGLVTEQTRIFDVSWLAPTAPLLQITEGEGLSASIDVMATTYTESGTVLEASSSMMESLAIHGKSVQDGTPTPSAPKPIRSVESGNLSPFFSKAFSDTSYWSSVNAAYTKLDDGWAHVVSDRTQSGYVHPYAEALRDFSIDPSATYTLLVEVRNCTMTGTGSFVVATGATYPWESNTSAVIRTGSYFYALSLTSKSSPNTSGLARFSVQVNSGKTECDVRLSIWKGAPSPSGYAPVGSILVHSVGENLADDSSGYHVGVSGSGTLAIADAYRSVICPLPPSELPYEVTVSRATVEGQYFRIYTTDTFPYAGQAVTTLYSGTTDLSKTVTVPASARWLIVVLDGSGATITSGNVKVQLGSTATAYEPYSSTTTPIPVTLRSLPDGTHDEWISGETEDTLVQRVGEVDMGTLTWQWNANGYFYATVSQKAAGNYNVLCTNYAVTHSDSASGMLNGEIKGHATSSSIFVKDSSYSDAATFKAGVSGVYVLFGLATTITTTLPHVTLPYVDGSAWVDAEVTPQIEATFRPVDFPDQPAADSVDVVRVNADGSTWTVASGLSVGDTAIDPLPPLGVPVEYRAVGTAPSGATSSGSYTETIGGRGWVLNFGNAAQEHIEFVYNPQADLSLKQGGTPYHFADGGRGRGLPVFYPTTDRDYAGTLKFDTILYGDTDKVLDLCDRYPVAWLRDPFGHRWRAHVAPSVSHGVGQIWPVTLSWDAMRFEEAWDG